MKNGDAPGTSPKLPLDGKQKKMLNYVVLSGEGGLLRKAIYNIRSIDMSFKLLKSRRSAPVAAIICVSAAFAAARVCLAYDPWPSYELVANGDFEAGTVFKNNSGNYLESLTGSNNANIPGWTLANCVKAKASGVYIASGLPIGTYAICLKTQSGVNSSFYQDVTVPAPGVYRISFQWAARPKSGKTEFNKETITVSFSQVVDGTVPTENVLTT